MKGRRYLDVLESPHAIRYIATAGERRELHANSIGKALLAAMDEAERATLLAQLPFQAFTSRTLTTPAALEADLQQARERGAYVNLSESMPDVGALAWPVRLSGECYAISIAGPVYRIEPHLDRYAPMLRAACAALEKPERSQSARRARAAANRWHPASPVRPRARKPPTPARRHRAARSPHWPGISAPAAPPPHVPSWSGTGCHRGT
jgi:hypothetical protein